MQFFFEKVLIDGVKFIDCSGSSFGGSFWNQGPDHPVAVSHPDALPVKSDNDIIAGNGRQRFNNDVNNDLGYSLNFTIAFHCQVMGGIPPPSGGIVGKPEYPE